MRLSREDIINTRDRDVQQYKAQRPNKAVRLAALYTFCSDYHSGQWSRGYRLLCRTAKAWKRHAGIDTRLEYWQCMVRMHDNPIAREYFRLVEAHGEDV
jgi:hypothetical protein